MTDDEAKQWLSEEERIAWNDSDNTPTERARHYESCGGVCEVAVARRERGKG